MPGFFVRDSKALRTLRDEKAGIILACVGATHDVRWPVLSSTMLGNRVIRIMKITGLILVSAGVNATVGMAAWAQESGFADALPAYMAPKVTSSMLLDGHRAGDRMVVVGEHGHILVSDDDGQAWKQVSSPTRSALTGVAFSSATHGFAVGHDAVILRTVDGGQSWERVYFDPQYQTPLLDVWTPSPQRAIAVGAYGLFLETTDGGDNWEQVSFSSEPLPVAGEEAEEEEASDDGAAENPGEDDDWDDEEFAEDYHLNQIASAPDGTLYIAGEAGNFYRSEDQGKSWYRLDVPYEGSFFCALPLGDSSVLALGMRGNLFRSDDRGVTFAPVETGVDALLTSGYQAADQRVLLAGLAGVVLESADGGRTFTLYRQSNRKGAMQALPTGADGTLLIGEAGVARLTRGELRAGGVQ